MLLLLYILARRSMSQRQKSQKRTNRHTSVEKDATVAVEILGKTDRQIQVRIVDMRDCVLLCDIIERL